MNQKRIDVSYKYQVVFYAGLDFISNLKYHGSVSIESDFKLTEEEVKKRAYSLIGAYPKSHTIRIFEESFY